MRLPALLVMLLTLLAGHATEFTIDNIRYTLEADGTCSLTDGSQAAGDVSLPAVIEADGNTFNLTAIAPSAFSSNNALTAIDIPATVRSVGDDAFYFCQNLKMVTLRGGNMLFGGDAFRGCARLRSVMAASIEDWLTYDFRGENSSPLSPYGSLYIAGELLEHLVIPEGVATVRQYAFFNCASLKSIDFGEAVTLIETEAFDGCENVGNIIFSPGLTAIGDYAFAINVGLTEVTLPASCRSIGRGGFYGCSGLTSFSAPGGLEEIPDITFAGCTSLANTDFLYRVRSIGDEAFLLCQSITSLNLPEGLESIGSHAFQDCSSLRTVALPSSLSSMGSYIFLNCRVLSEVQLPGALESVPAGLLMQCPAISSVKLPESVTEIGDYAFAQCTGLKYLDLPAPLAHIGQMAFYGCSALRSMEFGDAMAEIGAEAFYNCPKLNELRCRAIDPPAISYFTFDPRMDAETILYVPESATDLYANAYGWKLFSHIEGDPSYNPDTRLEIIYGEGGKMTRVVGYGTSLRLILRNADGTLPERVIFNGIDMTSEMTPEGEFTTPRIESPSVLTIM